MSEEELQTVEIKRIIDMAIKNNDHEKVCEGYERLAEVNMAMEHDDMALNALSMSEAIAKKYDLGLRKQMMIQFREIEIYHKLGDYHYAGYRLMKIEEACLDSEDLILIEDYTTLKELVMASLGYPKVC